MLCANKISVIYFCPNCVNFLPENVHFLFIYLFIYLYYYYLFIYLFIYLFFFLGGDCPLPLPPARPSMSEDHPKLQDPQWLLRQKTFFDLLGMVYDKVGNGINFHMRILVL